MVFQPNTIFESANMLKRNVEHDHMHFEESSVRHTCTAVLRVTTTWPCLYVLFMSMQKDATTVIKTFSRKHILHYIKLAVGTAFTLVSHVCAHAAQ